MKATVVVQFGQGANSSALVLVELDGELNRTADDQEKTQFFPGDRPVWLVHHDATVRIGSVACSSGMIQPLGQVTRTRTQQMQFPAGEAMDLPYVPAGAVSVQWYGNNGGLVQTGRSVRATGSVPAIGEVSVPVRFSQYRLIPPALSLAGEETWPVLIVVEMEAA